jgi:CRISPR/Cas system-associated exonuclease Cas4 (RecB family)
MKEVLRLDQRALATYEYCPRRFQLRYLRELPWPRSPLDQKQVLAMERGRQFHRLVEQYFLGLVVEANSINDDIIRGWWEAFAQSELILPEGERRPEQSLTIPIDGHFLTGRFDLLILGEKDGNRFAQLYDWKTSRPRSRIELEKEWQTRLYLALLTESANALAKEWEAPAANQVALTYWYAGEPDQPRTITYSDQAHRRSWMEIAELVREIESRDADDVWPLTADYERCRSCMYQSYCGRQAAGVLPGFVAEEEAEYLVEMDLLFEPESP